METYGNAHEIPKRLDQLPAELSDLFEELLGRGTLNAYLSPLLRWVAFGVPPLTRKELYSALLLEIQADGSSCITHEAFKPVSSGTMDKFPLENSKGLVEVTRSRNESVQFIYESMRTYFLKEGLRYLTKDLESAEHSPARGRTVSSGTDGDRLIVATCYDQMKQRCLFYLMESVWRNIKLPVRLPIKKSSRALKALEALRSRVGDDFPLFDHALHELFKYAEHAHKNGLQQHEFLDSLRLVEFGTLHNIGGHRCINYMSGEITPTEATSWYKAKLLVIYSCPILASVVLATMPVLQANTAQWTEILTIGLNARDIGVVETTLEHRTAPKRTTAIDGWHCLRVALTGPHRGDVVHALKNVQYYVLENLHNAMVEGDIAGIHRLLQNQGTSYAPPTVQDVPIRHVRQPPASQPSLQ